jgi:hypothetical protein
MNPTCSSWFLVIKLRWLILPVQLEAFEVLFGAGRAGLSSNDTRWNSAFHQINYIIELDVSNLNEALKKEEQPCLILSAKEMQQLHELVTVLRLAEATDTAQGSTYVTISCIVSLLVTLMHGLSEQVIFCRYQQPLVQELIRNLFTWFQGIFDQLHISCPQGMPSPDRNVSKDLQFNSHIYVMAASLDLEHGY